MNTGNKKKPEIDDLLRRAFAGDLPEEAAAGMRRRIARFRETKRGDGAAGRGDAAAWAWIFRRGVWAVLSVLLLVAGVLLQSERSSSPLAQRVAALKTQYASLELPRR